MHGAGNFSFVNVLSGISKTLGVAKEVIPLWQQTKPLINNVKTAYSLIRKVNSKNLAITNKNSNRKENIKNFSEKKTINKSYNNPQFFI